jgi:hypothetical protein
MSEYGRNAAKIHGPRRLIMVRRLPLPRSPPIKMFSQPINERSEQNESGLHSPIYDIPVDVASLRSPTVALTHLSGPTANPSRARRRLCMLPQALQEIFVDPYMRICPGEHHEQVESDAASCISRWSGAC